MLYSNPRRVLFSPAIHNPTTRKDGTPVQKWVSKILDLYRTLSKEDKDWAKLAESDAAHRVHAFLSKRELEVIDNHLVQANKANWDRAGRSTFGYLRKYGITKTVEQIIKISPDKFPGNYIAKQHSPFALKSSLYTWEHMQRIVTSHDEEKNRAMAKLQQERARDKSDIAKLKRQLAETKGPRKSYATAAANANALKNNKPANAPSVPAAGNPHVIDLSLIHI